MTRNNIQDKLNLVIDKLIHLDAPENEEALESGGEAKGFFCCDFGINEWDWPQGVGLYGLLKMMQYNGTNEYREFLINNKMWIDTLFMTVLFFHGWSFNRMDNFGGVFGAGVIAGSRLVFLTGPKCSGRVLIAA